MEDGVKEDPAQSKEPKFLGKAGWVKKAPGRLLASYKDRYIHVEKTEIVVYENEDRQNCLERLDLENYDKCHELKSPFKKKHRLILIRSPKSGNKVSRELLWVNVNVKCNIICHGTIKKVSHQSHLI
ncbi:pleckstrin homology domain-containing family O member 2-like [Morone saxatilis]|uniref:pleckstrin homology domain-containing family O member 2-like n=1 Tax=Morone saxatilis TaxID=34816 RepID=UPI0015E1CF01|nr:pleckstrin homology domain-containing family O member 2-like [Morone saxatilis]